MGSIAAPQPRSRHLATPSLLLPDPDRYLHDFRLRDAQGCRLVEHGGIWLLELNKFHAELVRTEQERAAKEAALAELERPKAQMRTQEGKSSGKSEKGRAENGPKVERLGYGCS